MVKFQDASQLKKEGEGFVLTKGMLLAEVVEKSPAAAKLLAEYGLSCTTCFANSFDTLQDGAIVHGMTDEEVDQMINEINEEINKK
jgi:hybrid cluster-associated redox disulfide protein